MNIWPHIYKLLWSYTDWCAQFRCILSIQCFEWHSVKCHPFKRNFIVLLITIMRLGTGSLVITPSTHKAIGRTSNNNIDFLLNFQTIAKITLFWKTKVRQPYLYHFQKFNLNVHKVFDCSQPKMLARDLQL